MPGTKATPTRTGATVIDRVRHIMRKIGKVALNGMVPTPPQRQPIPVRVPRDR